MHSTRLKVLIAFAIAAVLALPIWYFTTRVERAALPHEAIERAFASQAHDAPLVAALRVVVVVVGQPQQRCAVDASALQRLVDAQQLRTSSLRDRPSMICPSDARSLEHAAQRRRRLALGCAFASSRSSTKPGWATWRRKATKVGGSSRSVCVLNNNAELDDALASLAHSRATNASAYTIYVLHGSAAAVGALATSPPLVSSFNSARCAVQRRPGASTDTHSSPRAIARQVRSRQVRRRVDRPLAHARARARARLPRARRRRRRRGAARRRAGAADARRREARLAEERRAPRDRADADQVAARRRSFVGLTAGAPQRRRALRRRRLGRARVAARVARPVLAQD
jgi:hypothetical protein